MTTEDGTPPQSHALLRRRGIRLEWATNGWNVLEVFISIALGIQAQSLALIAFGLDSVVEVFASTIVIRNLSDHAETPVTDVSTGRCGCSPLPSGCWVGSSSWPA